MATEILPNNSSKKNSADTFVVKSRDAGNVKTEGQTE